MGSSLVTTDTLERRGTTGLLRVLREGWTLGQRNLKHFTRLPRLLVFSTIQPMMFVLLFGYVFDGVVRGSLPDGYANYLAFVMPGIYVQSTVFRMTQTAVGLAEDLERGVIDRFRSLPMSRSAVMVGRTIADLVRSMVVILLMTAVGMVVGFRFTGGPLGAIGALAIVALFGYALSWVFVYVALHVPGAESAQAASFVAAFPLSFVSSVFVPPESVSVGWLSAIATHSPVSAAADAARGLAVTGPVADPVLRTLLWSLGLLVVFVPLAVRRFRRLE